MTMRLYVGNLSYQTTEGDLQRLFEQAGAVKSCQIVMDRFTNKSRGFAFVEMDARDDGAKAIETLNGADCDGRRLVVNEARPREERGFGGGGGGGFGGGDRGPRPDKGGGRRGGGGGGGGGFRGGGRRDGGGGGGHW